MFDIFEKAVNATNPTQRDRIVCHILAQLEAFEHEFYSFSNGWGWGFDTLKATYPDWIGHFEQLQQELESYVFDYI